MYILSLLVTIMVSPTTGCSNQCEDSNEICKNKAYTQRFDRLQKCDVRWGTCRMKCLSEEGAFEANPNTHICIKRCKDINNKCKEKAHLHRYNRMFRCIAKWRKCQMIFSKTSDSKT